MGQRGNFLLFNLKHKQLWPSIWYTPRQTQYQSFGNKIVFVKDLLQALVHFNWQQIWKWFLFSKFILNSIKMYSSIKFQKNLKAFMLQIKLYSFAHYYLTNCFVVNFAYLNFSIYYKYLTMLKHFIILNGNNYIQQFLRFFECKLFLMVYF